MRLARPVTASLATVAAVHRDCLSPGLLWKLTAAAPAEEVASPIHQVIDCWLVDHRRLPVLTTWRLAAARVRLRHVVHEHIEHVVDVPAGVIDVLTDQQQPRHVGLGEAHDQTPRPAKVLHAQALQEVTAAQPVIQRSAAVPLDLTDRLLQAPTLGTAESIGLSLGDWGDLDTARHPLRARLGSRVPRRRVAELEGSAFATPHLLQTLRQVLAIEESRVGQTAVDLIEETPLLTCCAQVPNQMQNLVKAGRVQQETRLFRR